MRIVHIIGTMNTGGAERMLSNILTHSDPGHEHILIILKEEEIKYKIPNKIEIYQFEFRKRIGVLKEMFRLKRTLNQLKPDIIQTWMYHSDILGLVYKKIFNKKVKLIWNIRHSVLTPKKYSLKYFLLKLLKENSSTVDGLIFVSKESYSEHEKINFQNENSIVIPNGFDTHRQVEESKREELNIKESALVIGHVGRYASIKNQKEIMKAFNSLKKKSLDITLMMIGRGMTSENSNLMKYVETENRDSLLMLGEQFELDRFYNIMDVFVLTSFSEGYPNVVGESMVNGTPVITTDAGDSFEIVGETGYKMASYTSEELVDILKEIYYERNRLKENGENAKKRIIENYDILHIVQLYTKFYEKTLKQAIK